MTGGLLAPVRFARAIRGARMPGLGTGRRRAARFTLATFALGVLALQAGAILWLDEIPPRGRDPEYGRRTARYLARVRENPGRPAVMVIGSSRAAMGVRPTAWEEIRSTDSAPLLFNMSMLGSGPIMELVVARRVFADGLRPDIVLFEYWPPYLYSEREWSEPARIARDRLSPIDRPVVGEYFPDRAHTDARMRKHRVNPIWESRERILLQFVPKWLPQRRRIDWTWDDVDAWGWKPGFDFPQGPSAERTALIDTCRAIYRSNFDNYRISPVADRALRDAVAVARAHGARAGFLYLPESSEFRVQYPAGVERVAREHLEALRRELGVPVIDAREWMDDGLLVDGFHLSRVGAVEFTRRLGPAIAAAFPEARR